MSEPKYYVLCQNNCRYESMTKEQIIAAIAEATGNVPSGLDEAFISKVKEGNANAPLMFWLGTIAEYNAITSKEANTLYIATTDNGYELFIGNKVWDIPTPTPEDIGAVPTTRKINNKELGTDVTLTASDVGARPDTWMPTASDVGARPDTWTPTAANVGAVPTSRTVNGKALSSNITLSASDVGARANTWTPTASDVGAAASSHKHAAGDITSGTLGVSRGGTGQTSVTPAVTTAGLRQIYAGTSDMTAGSSSLTTGVVYLVYEA